MNRTLASQTSLGFRKATVTRRTLIRKLEAYRSLYQRPMQDDLAWCQPYVAMMAGLMAEVRVRG